jgi:hypothetical protein
MPLGRPKQIKKGILIEDFVDVYVKKLRENVVTESNKELH